jgi:multiple sugar transport system permease protein
VLTWRPTEGVQRVRTPGWPGLRRRVQRALSLVALVAAALFFAVPLIWLILAPTKSPSQMSTRAPLGFGSFGQLGRTWDTLYAFDRGVLILWIRNSVIYCAAGALISVGVGLPAGYGLAVTHFIGRKTLLTVTLVTMLVPTNALVLPLFLEMHDVHLLGTPFGVILPFSFFPFGVYLAYLYFESTLPNEVLGAARIDGCSEWLTFRYIALPLATPVVGLMVLFNVVANWSNFFLPFVMLQGRDQFPVALGLQVLQSIAPPELALALLVSCAPVMLVFLLGQRSLTSGLRGGFN